MTKKNTDLTIEQRIKRAEKKINKFFEKLDDEKKEFIADSVHQLAVTRILLERLSENLKNEDLVVEIDQGKQHLRCENPALKSWNTTIKSYTALFKQLVGMLPEESAKAAGAEITKFIQDGIDRR